MTESSDAALAAPFETTVFLKYFKDLLDDRQADKVTYPLDEILLLSLLAVLAGAGLHRHCAFRQEEARAFAPLSPFATNTPNHDHLEREIRCDLPRHPGAPNASRPLVRDHCAGNGLHWVMNMTFRDDECRIRTEHVPETSSP